MQKCVLNISHRMTSRKLLKPDAVLNLPTSYFTRKSIMAYRRGRGDDIDDRHSRHSSYSSSSSDSGAAARNERKTANWVLSGSKDHEYARGLEQDRYAGSMNLEKLRNPPRMRDSVPGPYDPTQSPWVLSGMSRRDYFQQLERNSSPGFRGGPGYHDNHPFDEEKRRRAAQGPPPEESYASRPPREESRASRPPEYPPVRRPNSGRR